jgi:hypothetical protein
MSDQKSETVTQPPPRPGTPPSEKSVPTPVADEQGKAREGGDGRDQPPAASKRDSGSPWLGGG